MSSATDRIVALQASVERLRVLVEDLSPEDLARQSYCDDWTVAQVLSHIGSGAEIGRANVEAVAGGTTTPGGFHQGVWDAWNAKEPTAQRDDALVVDNQLVDTLREVASAPHDDLVFAIGPMQLDLGGLVGLRLNEHALHSWDIAMAFDPTATLPDDAAELLIGNVSRLAGFLGRPDGSASSTTVRTTAPEVTFVLEISADAVSLRAEELVGNPDVQLPAEELIRLVYGRLDSSDALSSEQLTQLQAIFPGF